MKEHRVGAGREQLYPRAGRLRFVTLGTEDAVLCTPLSQGLRAAQGLCHLELIIPSDQSKKKTRRQAWRHSETPKSIIREA
jgi:hypothetical protein